jgi:ribosomal protein S4E
MVSNLVDTIKVNGFDFEVLHRNEHMPKFVVVQDEDKLYRIVRMDNKQIYKKGYTQLTRARNTCDRLVKELMAICAVWVDFSDFWG